MISPARLIRVWLPLAALSLLVLPVESGAVPITTSPTAVLAVLNASPSISTAGTIIQDQVFGTKSFLDNGWGQSFTAEDSLILSIGVRIQDRNPFLGGFTFTMTLFDGVGTGGTTLASDTITPTPIPFGDWVDFDFTSVVLNPGNSYTFEVTSLSGRGAVEHSQHSYFPSGLRIIGRVDYAGGDEMINGETRDHADLRFRVFPVPEPSTALLLTLGLVGLAAKRKRSN